MESNAATAGAGTESLIFTKGYHTIYEYCRRNPVREVRAEIDISMISDTAKRRIKDFCLKGVVSPGIGMDLINLLQNGNIPLSYMYVNSYRRQIPSLGYKLRPHVLRLFNDDSARLLTELKNYNTADIARWKMMSDGKPVPSMMADGILKAYIRNSSKQLALSGYQTKLDLVKHFSPLIMQGERLERGKELYDLFLNTKTLVMVTP